MNLNIPAEFWLTLGNGLYWFFLLWGISKVLIEIVKFMLTIKVKVTETKP